MGQIRITTEQSSYPVIIGENIYQELADFLGSAGITNKSKLMIITDSNVAPLYLKKIVDTLTGFTVVSYVVEAGEQAKSLEHFAKIISFAISEGLDRSSVVLALGGGVVGDLAGFVAAVYMRGIAFVQLPTTILAHDSSVGGKVAINHPLGKNLVGAFYPPKLVVYDTSFLATLPIREVRGGLAELVKHALIADKKFADWLSANAEELLNLNLLRLSEALFQGIKVKAAIVQKDEKEQGVRAFLNYGHTFAHVVEIISNYSYSHGEAVAIGMAFASRLAYRLGMIDKSVDQYTRTLLERFSLPTAISGDYGIAEMLNIMMRDKKFIHDRIRMVLPTAIGQVIIQEGLEKKNIAEVLEEIKNTDRI